MIAIFGASVAAARETDSASVVVAQSAFQAPIAQVIDVPVAEAVEEPIAEVAVAPADVQQAASQTRTTNALLALPTAATTIVVDQVPAAPSDDVLELLVEIEERDRQIAALEEQLVFLRQAQLSELHANQTTQLSNNANGRISDAANEDAMDQWRAGYTLGGGQNLPAFESTILPCESGTQPNPDVAVGRTDDWGRAQINRRTWKARFESLTGADFETGIVDPVLNGYMAAHVEQEQGLKAWTCWRKRR